MKTTTIHQRMKSQPVCGFVLASVVFIAGSTCGPVSASQSGFTPRGESRAFKFGESKTGRRRTSVLGLLNAVREQLRPSTSLLARALGVSRQTVYNWHSDETPRPGMAERIEQLAKASALIFAQLGAEASRYSRIPIQGGRSFWDLIADGLEPTRVANSVIALANKKSMAVARPSLNRSGERSDSGESVYDEHVPLA